MASEPLEESREASPEDAGDPVELQEPSHTRRSWSSLVKGRWVWMPRIHLSLSLFVINIDILAPHNVGGTSAGRASPVVMNKGTDNLLDYQRN